MSRLHLSSGAQQVAEHLRGELLRGAWAVTMPGRAQLAEELGVSGKLVEAALAQLEREGLLVSQGPRRRRRITLQGKKTRVPELRVGILLGDNADRGLNYMAELIHELEGAGHHVTFASQTLVELGMNVNRVEQMVQAFPADAWIVMAASCEVLEWFAVQPVPAIALFGRRGNVDMAGVGPKKTEALLVATRRLVGLGHRRIVLLTRPRRRIPEPGKLERAFLNELSTLGIPPSVYHLPDWEDTVDGFHACLESLFQLTPPTALILDEAPFVVAAQQFLAQAGMAAPRDVSMICLDPAAAFDWCKPTISHIRWDHRPVVRRLVRWVENVAQGRDDRRKVDTQAEFVEGGTVGPAPIEPR
jgi:DNA-binding LacI/PurR family transcriptional regulator